jgi:hypothetical protein
MDAKELCSKHFDGLHNDDVTYERIQKYAIEFAKHHVVEALMSAKKSYKLILENEENETSRILPNKSYRLNESSRIVVDELSIILSYDLDNIE